MKLYHSTCKPITEVHGYGPFGSHLFFSYDFQRSMGDTVYCIDIDDDHLVEASQLLGFEVDGNMRETVREVLSVVEGLLGDLPEGFDEWDAGALLTERRSIHRLASDHEIDSTDVGEAAWAIQALTAQAAKIAGFRGVVITDEMGSSVMCDMLGHEAELRTVNESEDE